MKKHFLTGLVILLPLAITLAIIFFIVNFLTQPFVGFVSGVFNHRHVVQKGFLFLTPEQTIRYGSQLIILLCICLLILVIGFLAKRYFVHLIISMIDQLMHRLPLINKIYKTSKEIILNIFSSDKQSFKKVAIVPFPGEGIYALGFLTNDSPLVCSLKVKKHLISIFIPTTPNPATGFLLMYDKEQVHFVDMKVETALKYIVSCGLAHNLEDSEPAGAST